MANVNTAFAHLIATKAAMMAALNSFGWVILGSILFVVALHSAQ
jgi:hypothetical protein